METADARTRPLASTSTSIPLRAWRAWRGRGSRYVLHKTLRRSLERWPGLKRRLVYGDPRDYWTLRGGLDYFLEQEGQAARGRRAEWLAERIASYRPASVLEIGCGYGKQLRALRWRLDGPLVGLDFSPTQLAQGRAYLDGIEGVELVLGSGASLPFPDDAFDLVMTSAVILHNPPEVAERIRREVVRVARRWAAHNEDTDVSYNRFGYDTAAWYERAGIAVAEVLPIPIPIDEDPLAGASQFCVADLTRSPSTCSADRTSGWLGSRLSRPQSSAEALGSGRPDPSHPAASHNNSLDPAPATKPSRERP